MTPEDLAEIADEIGQEVVGSVWGVVGRPRVAAWIVENPESVDRIIERLRAACGVDS